MRPSNEHYIDKFTYTAVHEKGVSGVENIRHTNLAHIHVLQHSMSNYVLTSDYRTIPTILSHNMSYQTPQPALLDGHTTSPQHLFCIGGIVVNVAALATLKCLLDSTFWTRQSVDCSLS